MRLRFSEIGHWIGWCPKKRKSQIVPDQDFMGFKTIGGFMMDAKKDEIGIIIPLTFPKRMFMYVSLVLFILNIIVFYLHEKISLDIVLGASTIEIVAMAIFFAYWIPKLQSCRCSS